MLKHIQEKSYFLIKAFLSIFILLISTKSLAHQPKIGEWSTTIAQFEIIDTNVKDLKLEDTVLEALIKASGKDFNTYLEKDKKILRSFKITYRVPIKLKKGQHAKEEEIIQYGLFKALPQAMQDKVEIQPTQAMPIQYKTRDPLLIEFVVKDETFDAPALLTDKLELFKKANKAKKN